MRRNFQGSAGTCGDLHAVNLRRNLLRISTVVDDAAGAGTSRAILRNTTQYLQCRLNEKMFERIQRDVLTESCPQTFPWRNHFL